MFERFVPVRESGKSEMKYIKVYKEKKYVCDYCEKKYASASGLHYHHTYKSVKKGVSECNLKHHGFFTIFCPSTIQSDSII